MFLIRARINKKYEILPMNIEKYRKDAEEFLSLVEKEYYLHFSGQKENLNISDIYIRFRHLFERDNISYLKSLKDKTSGEGRKRASYLLKFCTEGFMEEQVKDLVDKIAGDEARAKIEIEGKKIELETKDKDKGKKSPVRCL